MFKSLKSEIKHELLKNTAAVVARKEILEFYHFVSIFSLVKYLHAFKMPCTVLRLVYSGNQDRKSLLTLSLHSGWGRQIKNV